MWLPHSLPCQFAKDLHTWVTQLSKHPKIAHFNTLRPRQNGLHFADDILKRIFLREYVRVSVSISLIFVPNGQNNYIPSLVQIMAWRRSGDKPLSEPMVVSLLTHICVTRPQWVNQFMPYECPYNIDMHDIPLCPRVSCIWHCSVAQVSKFAFFLIKIIYHQISNIRCTQSPKINVSPLVLQFSLPNPLKPGVKLRIKMYLEQRR